MGVTNLRFFSSLNIIKMKQANQNLSLPMLMQIHATILALFVSMLCNGQSITTTTLPTRIYKPPVGSSGFTYCVTVFGDGVIPGSTWELASGFIMNQFIGDGADPMRIIRQDRNSCTIRYTPSSSLSLTGINNLAVRYRISTTSFVTHNFPLEIMTTLPTSIGASPSSWTSSLSPSQVTSLLFTLNDDYSEYSATVSSVGWTITQNVTNRREFTLSGNAPSSSGPFTIPVSFTPLCGGTSTTLNFTGTVVAPVTDVSLESVPTSAIFPIAMRNRPYPAVGSLPGFTATGGLNGPTGNSHNWSITGPSFLSLSSTSTVSQGTIVNVNSIGVVPMGITNPFPITITARHSDAPPGSTGPGVQDSRSFSVNVLPELTINLTPSPSSMVCLSGGGICYNGSITSSSSVETPICDIEVNDASATLSLINATSEEPYTLPAWLAIRPTPTTPGSSANYTLFRTNSPESGDIREFRIRFTLAGYSTISAPIRINIARQPVDIVFVLDKSGSMNYRAVSSGENTNTRWFYLEEAMQVVKTLINNQSLLNSTDRVGAVLFSSNIELPNSLSLYDTDLLQDISDNINEAMPRGSTGMGAGLVTALRWLCRDCPGSSCGTNEGSCDNRKKIIILFTDGDQNLNPALSTTPTRARINSIAFPSFRNTIIPADINDWFINNYSSNIDLTSTEFNSKDYKIFTIALDGVTPTNASMHERLSNLSNLTGAAHDAIISHLEEGTRVDFSTDFTNTLTGALRGGSPQILDNRKRRLSSSGLGEETFQVNDRVESLSFVVTSDPALIQRFRIRVFKGAQEFSLTSPLSYTSVARGETYTMFTILFKNPNGVATYDPRGEWRVQVQGLANDNYRIMAVVDEHFFDYECFMQKSVVMAGEGLDFVANVDYSGALVPNLNITAQILGPGEDLPTLISNTPTPAAIRPWLQSDYTWNLELYNKLGIRHEGTVPDRDFTLSGRAIDSKGAPISNAVVTVVGKDIKTTTDKNGAYTLSKIRLGDKLSLSKDNSALKEILITSAALLTGQLLVDFLVGSTPERVDTILANIIRLEPGISPAEAKVEYLRRSGLFDSKISLQPNVYQLLYQGDGRYSVPYPGSSNTITGSHNILYHIEGEIPGVGSIQRYTTNSGVVKFGLLDLRASVLEFLQENTSNGLTFGKIIIKPVDQYGHLIGLNRGFNINITSNGNSTFKLGPFVDRLDGSYVFPVSYNPSNGTPQIKIVVDEQAIPLFEGSIDEVPKEQEKEKFKLPFALGAAIPLGNSATAYDPGVMAELKLGAPLSKNKKLNLNLEGGFYSFDQKPQTDAFQIWGAAIGLRYDIKSVLGGNVFVDANPLGFYKPISQKGAYGLNFGAGIFWNVFTPKLSIGLDGSYYSIFANPETISFLGLGAGIRINPFK